MCDQALLDKNMDNTDDTKTGLSLRQKPKKTVGFKREDAYEVAEEDDNDDGVSLM